MPAALATALTGCVGPRAGGAAAAPATASAVQALTAEARILGTGPRGRVRGTALIWLARPDLLRVHVLGPHGGLLAVVACDGQQLATFAADSGLVTRRPATASDIEAQLPLPPLGLDARGWVSLLLGDEVRLGDRSRVDQLQRPGADGWEARVVAREQHGLPSKLSIRARDGGSWDVRLRDIELHASLAPALFALATPDAAGGAGDERS